MGVDASQLEKYGLSLHARFKAGKLNKITDVPGVKVGQVTLNDPARNLHTGVTAIIPAQGNVFQDKLLASGQVLNGFGKTTGLVQVQELGTLETPVLLTNTFAVGTCWNALTRYMLARNPDIGIKTGTVNPVVMECNDGDLNDIRAAAVTEADALAALRAAESGPADFAEGAVGAGTGMCCLGFKGGIGSASRVLSLGQADYHLGVLVSSNFGVLGNLRIGDRFVGEETKEAVIARAKAEHNPRYARYWQQKDQGSIVMVIACDLPLSSRQLGRLARRAAVGLARTGSYIGDGSGDIALAFSTASRISHYAKDPVSIAALPDSQLDDVFAAGAEAVEEAVISALLHAQTLAGIRGNTVYALRDFLTEQLQD